MSYLVWSQVFSVGVPVFDAEHQGLIALINRCHEMHLEGAAPAAVYEVLNALVRYAEEHFAHEQGAMERHHYPERLRHGREHDRLLEEVFALNRRLSAGEAEVGEDVLAFLREWLLQHILHADRGYADFFSDKQVD